MCALVIIINIYIVYYCMITCKVYWPTTLKSKVGCVFPNSTWSIKEMIIVKTQPTLFVLPQIDLKLPGISKPSLSPNRHKPSLFGISLISFSSFNSIPRLSRNRICLINLNEQKSRFLPPIIGLERNIFPMQISLNEVTVSEPKESGPNTV